MIKATASSIISPQQEQHASSRRRPTHTVPRHMFGCWDRRSIRLPADSSTESTDVRVVWVQTPSGHGDIRIPKQSVVGFEDTTDCDDRKCDEDDKTNVTKASSLADCSDVQLLELAAAADSSCGQCELSEHITRDHHGQQQCQARWILGATGFAQQVVNPWPDHGWLEWPLKSNDGDQRLCMMEYAPDGEYLEDWRLSPGSSGMCCHLTTTTMPRRNIYIAGRHLLLAVDRTENPADKRPLVDICRAKLALVCQDSNDVRSRHRQQVETYLSSEFSYAKLKVDSSGTRDFCIELSTLPWRQGHTISMQWLWKALQLEEDDDPGDHLAAWHAKEGTMIGTDDQGVLWTLVSIDYRPQVERVV